MHFKLLAVSTSVLSFAISTATTATCPDGTSVANAKCCTLVPVLHDLQKNFFGEGEICPSLARKVLRVAFHDAIGFSKRDSASGGGADGSIIAFDAVEMKNVANSGLKVTISLLKRFLERHDISEGDFLHFAAAVGLSTCPGAPRLEYLFGRPPATSPASSDSVPEATDSADTIISRFREAGFSPNELVALMSAHSIGVANVDDIPRVAPPLDSTPKLFDTQFFLETLLPGRYAMQSLAGKTQVALSPIKWAARLPSDIALARHAETSCAWQGFINEQEKMMEEFKFAMLKLSTLGQNPRDLVDCSDLIPSPPPSPPTSAQYPVGFSSEDVIQSCKKRAPLPSAVEARSPVPTDGTVQCAFHTKRALPLQDRLNYSQNFTQVCCDGVGMTSDPSIAPVLEALGKEDLSPASGFVGLNCANFDDVLASTCANKQPLACPVLLDSKNGLVGLACSPLEISL